MRARHVHVVWNAGLSARIWMCEAVYVLKMILSQLHIVLSLPLWEGCTRIFSQWCIPLCPPTVSPYRSSAKRVYNTQSMPHITACQLLIRAISGQAGRKSEHTGNKSHCGGFMQAAKLLNPPPCACTCGTTNNKNQFSCESNDHAPTNSSVFNHM